MRRIASRKPFALTLAVLAGALCSCATAQPAPGYAVTARIPGADGGWDYAAVDPDLGRLYVARAHSVISSSVRPQPVQILALASSMQLVRSDLVLSRLPYRLGVICWPPMRNPNIAV